MKNRQSMAVTSTAEIEATLQVGQQMIVQKEVGQERTWARVVGWLPEGAVILDGPSQWVSMGQLFAQNRLLVRFISLGAFYGFTAKVLTVLKSPVLVVLEWPRQLDKVPLSTETRCAVHIPTRLAPRNRDGSFGEEGDATLTDISRGGCQARFKRGGLIAADFQQGRVVRLSVEVPGIPQTLVALAQVRNTQVTGSEVVMGLRFEDGQAKSLERLQLVLAPMLRLGETWDGAAAAPPAPAAPPAMPTTLPTTAKVVPKLPLDTQPLRRGAGPDPADPLFAEGPRVFEVPAALRVDTGAIHIPLEEMTAERAANIMGLRSIGGTLAAVIQAREVVRAWVEKYGEPAARERRRLLLGECALIQGLKLQK